MDISTLGKYCAKITCNRVDFAPIKCNLCKLDFCREHYRESRHNCPSVFNKYIELTKDKEGKRLYTISPSNKNPLDTPPDHFRPKKVIREHFNWKNRFIKILKNETDEIFTKQCSLVTCKRKEAISVLCPLCNKRFCLRHRNPDSHLCEKFKWLNNKRNFGTYIYTGWSDKTVETDSNLWDEEKEIVTVDSSTTNET
ncbi:unnamed protein product [Psylliodes chrysocephalus]|uniref:AN1-type domain-containing protein n=1 Tax=Psylliodes chrysocephalus TaxID=3402493 RepID=A0A9P0CMA4_9CUCU|nr:unnamed protein product [Psylliodes chrysocephala]